MSWLDYQRVAATDGAEPAREHQGTPGRATLTSRLPPSSESIARALVVQLRADGIVVQRQLGDGAAAAPAPALSNVEVADLLAALGRYDADVDLPRARAALDQFHSMNDRDTADVLERLRAQGQLQAVLDDQMPAHARSNALGRVDATLGVHFLILDGVTDAVAEAQAEWARRSFAEDGIAFHVLSRAHEDIDPSAHLLATSGNPGSADVNGTNEDGTPADPGAEANALLERAHRAGAEHRRDESPEAHAVFVPELTRGAGVAIRPGWYDTAFPGVIIAAGAGTSTLAHELGHLCGLNHYPNNEGTLTEGVQDPPDARSRNMYPEEGNRGSEWTPQEIETIKRSVYVRLTPRVVQREDGPLHDDPPPPGAGRALDNPVQRAGAGAGAGEAAGDDAHDVAAGGLRNAGAPLPHAEAIQRSFGHHDVGDVTTAIGGDAARAASALGAAAYASGNRIAFAESPDLHTAAHEAAHVIQQRQGVALADGFGRAGDTYERHADAVADRVVSGQSAADLLGAQGST